MWCGRWNCRRRVPQRRSQALDCERAELSGSPPSTAKRLAEGDELGACHPPRDDILDFKSKLLSLGIQDVDVIRQPSLIPLGRKLERLNRGIPGAGKAGQPTLFGIVARDRLVHSLHRTQHICLVSQQCLASAIISQLDTRIKRAEVQDRPVKRRTNPADVPVAARGPPWPPTAPVTATRGKRSAIAGPVRAVAAPSSNSALRQRHIEFIWDSLTETFLHDLKTLSGGFYAPAVMAICS
jgi:hypothetical protein